MSTAKGQRKSLDAAELVKEIHKQRKKREQVEMNNEAARAELQVVNYKRLQEAKYRRKNPPD